ncbi:peptide chain release factor N(5)-glutamine methyltransferase [Eubacterium oxidoreducens]|uniref:Release factor glutamine methyltransferase n=1 Tax=Eubacterium oxidoreducens TaxID=1732 RepID=A0A1G6BEZ8_EUBOX|nr:peptide chain release factor N(5)-glutamine methyltransferase [Eubacterium oxidoreducens]SDB19184.1 release factor glutamine methyltransferase [Eubacterium oxidoreducens]
MTLKEAYEYGFCSLTQADIEDARTDAFLLLEYICHVTKADFFMEPDKEMSLSEEKTYIEGIKKRCEHVPLQHITHEQEFMGYSFYVDEHVLIPRMETEELVLEVLNQSKDGMRVLDLCTGSGCIGIALKLQKPSLQVACSDISKQALVVAQRNAKALGAEVTLVESNLLENISGEFDIIVSNPPYIPTADIEELMTEVKVHEPFSALDGGEDGFEFYRQIISLSPRTLAEEGMLFLEIGYDQGDTIRDIMSFNGFCDVVVKKDLQQLDRIAIGKLMKSER